MKVVDKYVRKTIQFLVLLSVFLTFCVAVSCEKRNQNVPQQTETIEIDENTDYNETTVQTIDFDKMNEIIANAKTMDVEVFFAISVLHSRYIKSLDKEAAALSTEQREKFYTEKKNEFFKTMKFSESQYNDFMTNHVSELNNYINQYPEITQYLTTDN